MCIQSRSCSDPQQLVCNCNAEAPLPTTRSHVCCECIKVHWNRHAIGRVQGQKKEPQAPQGGGTWGSGSHCKGVYDGLNNHQNQTTNYNAKANAWQALH